MDRDNPTAWEEINPTRTALAQRPERRSELSRTLGERPKASPDQLQAELTACLALCGASGMTEDARCEWLKAARLTLEGIPAELLSEGAKKARLTCDHPSKIVPAIIAAIDAKWRIPVAHHQPYEGPVDPIARIRRLERSLTPDEITEFNTIMERLGGTTRYRPDGTRYQAEASERKPVDRGPPRRPTRADYIALGVDPSVLDSIEDMR